MIDSKESNKESIAEVFQEEIELAILKLRGTRNRASIERWLSNFRGNDGLIALDLLHQMTFVSEDELLVLCDQLATEIDQKVPSDQIIYFKPVSKYGKSGTLMTYYLCKSPLFQKMLKNNRAILIKNINDLRNTDFNENDVLVFYDDFFGTGGSLIKSMLYFKNNTNSTRKKINKVYGTALYYMPDAESKVKHKFPKLIFSGRLHNKQFDCNPIKYASMAQMNEFKGIFEKYAEDNSLFVYRGRKYNLGYGNSQALISFPYMPPNNTLPIIWGGSSRWKPLIPRDVEYILDNVHRLKKETAYAVSKMKLGLPPDVELKLNFTQSKVIIYGILRLIASKVAEVNICSLMSISLEDLEFYMDIAKKMSYLDDDRKLTEAGSLQLNKLIQTIKDHNIRLNDNLPFNNKPYVSKEFS